MHTLFSLLVLFGVLVCQAWGHGRLVDPPGRSSMWRYNYNTVINYNDNELFCGGFDRQWKRNGGKCGICGDPWDAPQPRDNEDGGMYGRGVIGRVYNQGQQIRVDVDVTAHHNGYFEFRVCPITSKNPIPDQDCLDRHVLQLADGSGTKFYLGNTPRLGDYPVHLLLPAQLTCERCVLQWHYHTANSWGLCADGKGELGCGPQETFRACADIAIEHVPSPTKESKKVPEDPVIPEKKGEVIPNQMPQVFESPELPLASQDKQQENYSLGCSLPETLKKLLPRK